MLSNLTIDKYYLLIYYYYYFVISIICLFILLNPLIGFNPLLRWDVCKLKICCLEKLRSLFTEENIEQRILI